MSNTGNFDAIDLHILKELQADARASHAAIARKVGITPPSVYERVKKLEQRGVICGYQTLLDPEAIGKPVVAFISVWLEGGSRYATDGTISDKIMNDPDVLEVHLIAGDENFLVKARAESNKALENLISRIRSINGIQRTRTTIALTSLVERIGPMIDAPPLPERIRGDDGTILPGTDAGT